MGKQKYGTRPNEFKYGMALYGAAWPPGDHYFVCGGGGHGLVPRIVWAKHHNGRCTDQEGEYKLGKETPMRMILEPSGSALLLGNSEGGIRRFHVDLRGAVPKLFEVSAAFTERFNQLRDEVKCMAFSYPRGEWLAVGFANGCVKILEYPTMKVTYQWSLKDGVKDIDFMPQQQQQHNHHQHRQHQQQGQQQQQLLLATTAEDGTCQVWDVASGQSIVQLSVGKGMEKCLFTRCRFGRGERPLLYVVINQRREASFLAVYGPEQQGGPWVMLRRVKVDNGPNAALEISRSGHLLALGQTSGRLLVYDAFSLQLVKKEEEANMVFITTVAFADDNTRVMAVGGDANCYVMDLVDHKGAGGGTWLMLLVLLLAALGAAAYFLATPEQLEWARQQLNSALGSGSSSSQQQHLLHPQVDSWTQTDPSMGEL